MASGKRRPGEDFEAYRARLKQEHKDLKNRLGGNLAWISSALIVDGDPNSLEDQIKPLKKIRVQGTYRKDKNET